MAKPVLIGQFDSPFVRRVAIALTLYKMGFEHRPWSVFADADKVAAINPLCRVPTFVTTEGTALTDSFAIIDHLDFCVGPSLAMTPQQQPARQQAQRITALACGMADKAVSLFYEKRLHEQVSQIWAGRCASQIMAVASALEKERSEVATSHWFGTEITHADIAVACAWRFVNEAHPGLLHLAHFPAIVAHCRVLEGRPVFSDICQPFNPPA